jgi:serine phosphatase RsbU (regulator of sigma subunit)
MSKLFKKALIIMVILFGIIATATSALSGWNIYRGLNEEFKAKGSSIALSLSDTSVGLLINSEPATLQSVIDQYLNIIGVAYIVIVDGGGDIVSHTFVPGIPEGIQELADRLDTQYLRSDVEILPLTYNDVGHFLNITSPVLGGVAGYVMVGMDRGIIKSQIISIVLKQQILMLVIFLLSIVLSYVLIKKISSPLNTLTENAAKLALSDLSDIDELRAEIEPIAKSSEDEIGDLARSFVFMEGRLSESIQNLTETITAKERIEGELNVAREIQLSILPQQFPPFPNVKEIDIDAKIVPAKEVGGDLYDFFFLEPQGDNATAEINEDKLFIVIGDVSGKGVPAALFMAVTKTLIKATASGELTPAQVLQKVNKELAADNDACMFVTLFSGVLDIHTGEFTYCSAGHNPPYLLSQDGRVSMLDKKGGLCLGVMDDEEYVSSNLTLKKGDILFLYTDGVPEAMDGDNNLYSDERLDELLNNRSVSDTEGIINYVFEDVRKFSGDTPQSDDITMLALRYNKS